LADPWLLAGWLVATTFVIRASGPVLFGGRELPRRATNVIALLAPALLAALVMTETFRGEGTTLTLDERAAGVGAAGLALFYRPSILLAGAVAMIVTAGLRAVT